MVFRKVVNITPMAKTKLINMLKEHKVNNALFYVKGGGCNGFKYMLEPVTEETKLDKTDEIIPLLDKDLNLRVCGKSLIHLIGTEIDWDSDFMGQSFRFNNPNADSSCGCGATFAPKFN